MRRSMVLGGAFIAAAALSACSAASNSDGSDEQKPGYVAFADDSLSASGELTVQVDYDTVETNGLDPATADTARSWSIMSLVYEPLVTIGPKFEVQPKLASKFEQTDPTTYVFTLASGVTFSNGRALTADDVVGSLKRLLASQSPYSAQLGPVKTVTATGDNEVTVMLSEPYTPFLVALANSPAAILPMKEIDAGTLDVKKEMLGTGPYVVKTHRQDESWTFEANPKFRDADKLKVKTLNLEIVPEEATRLAAVRDGSTGLAFFNNIDTLDLLDGTKNARVVSQKNSDFYYMMMNAKSGNPLLKDQKVRFAINAALDRAQISDIAFGGLVEPTSIAPSVLPDSCEAKDVPSEQLSDEETAKAVEDAGAKGKTIRLAVYASEPADGQIAQVVQQQLKKVGITVKIDKYDDATLGAKVYGPKPDFDLAVSWFAGYVDASMVSRWWNPDVAFFDKEFLETDPELNTLISKASTMPAGDERAKALQEMCDRADTNSGMLALVTRPSVIGYRTDKVSPTLYANEGYGNILRNISSFRIESAK